MNTHDQSCISSSSSNNNNNTKLKQAITLIQSLISRSHSIKIFASKWISIRNKLEDLLSNLTALQNCQCSNNITLSNTLNSINDTLDCTNDLVRRCSELSYSGKLLMQSDLDIVVTKLDNHVKSISDVYALGLVDQSYAIVVSRPSVSASRDDVRFYVEDLFSRFKIGSSETKKRGLVAFNEAVLEDERYLKCCVEIDGFVGYVVRFLESKDVEIQEEAARAVCLIAGFESCRSVLVVAGVIGPLVRVLESGGESSKVFAARCLMKVTESCDNAWSVSAHGGVKVLLEICSDEGCGNCELVNLACGVLKNLVGVEEIRRFIVDERAISKFVKLVRCKDEVKQISSLDLLQTMACKDEFVRECIVGEGGIRAFVRVLDPKLSFKTKTREMALKGIMNICEKSLSILISCGFMDHILYFLRYGQVSVQELALKAAFWLSETSHEAKRVMGEAGFMPVLVKFLDSKSFEIREVAAETISSMVLLPKNRKKFVQNDQNVGLVMQKLGPGEVNSGNNKNPLLSILMSLRNSNSARKQIVSSGYLKNIEKLAEDEVSDAKKIVSRLSSNRFSNIINGFWHS